MSVVALLDLSTFAAADPAPVPDLDPAAPERDEWDAETMDEMPEALEWLERPYDAAEQAPR
jgi:hypothetical protein